MTCKAPICASASHFPREYNCMLEWMTGSNIGNLLSTFLISMAPVVELRGGIPWGVAHDLPLWEAYITAVLGNMVPVPFVMLFMRKLLLWLHHFEKIGELADRIENRALNKGKKIEDYEALGLFLLVAVPLPGTGAWTGALVASLLDMRFRRAIPLIFLGVMAAGGLMLLLSHGVFNVVL